MSLELSGPYQFLYGEIEFSLKYKGSLNAGEKNEKFTKKHKQLSRDICTT